MRSYSQIHMIGDVYANNICNCGNTSNPNNLCDGSHWMCR